MPSWELGPSRLSDQHWLDKLAASRFLLRMPLVRCQGKLSIGPAEKRLEGMDLLNHTLR